CDAPAASLFSPLSLHDALPIYPAVAPYLAEFPRANGSSLGQGLAVHNFPFNQTIDQHFVQGRLDYNLSAGRQAFVRYTLDDTAQDRKSTRLNSSHVKISYAVFC